MKGSAVFRPAQIDGESYRYCLTREWDRKLPIFNSIGLNPSRADAEKNDPTVRCEIAFAQRMGFGSYTKTNLYALISPDPRVLAAGHECVGPDNDRYIRRYAEQADLVLLSCGAHPGIDWRMREVLFMLSDIELHCYGLTTKGYPMHPLRKSAFNETKIYRPAVRFNIA